VSENRPINLYVNGFITVLNCQVFNRRNVHNDLKR